MRQCLLTLLFFAPISAYAHNDDFVLPSNLWRNWSFEPVVLLLLVISATLFIIGLKRSRNASSTAGQRIAFCAGLFTLAVSQLSPLHKLGSTLFSAHMIQHELLMLVAAPLLVYSRPLATFVWAFSPRARPGLGALSKRRFFATIWSALSLPFTAWAIHAIALWTWHIPSLYEATLDSELIHALQHTSFLGSALLFWWALMHEQRVRNYGASVAYVFTTAIHSGALGALLTFAPTLVYPIYQGRTSAWGLTALEDQQLGGLIMWIPSSLVFLGIALWLFLSWLRESERRALMGAVGKLS
jgi:putative membrane protein